MVKLDKEDLDSVIKVYKIIIDALQFVPKDIYNDNKFGLIVVQAVLNILCSITKHVGVKKEEVMEALVIVWDSLEKTEIIN
jgi:hypothetical protein